MDDDLAKLHKLMDEHPEAFDYGDLPPKRTQAEKERIEAKAAELSPAWAKT